ncbi:MAG: hypothetical protein ABIO47_12155 [Sphingomicrobium sp.]
MRPIGTVERAFQLAPSCRSIDEIRAKLRREQCMSVEEHLTGASIKAELKKLLRS